MQNPRYALVAYVDNAAGQFVEQLRENLHPDLPNFPVHLTILPPRHLQGSELSALETLEEICSQVEPFEVTLGDAETFVPVTPTVFIRVAQGADHMHELHDRLSTRALRAKEEWPYMPHLTIAMLATEELAQKAYITARDLWAQFRGNRSVAIRELTFVREEDENRWVDLAGVPLGRSLVNR
jgi:2'-5' RNA ligase